MMAFLFVGEQHTVRPSLRGGAEVEGVVVADGWVGVAFVDDARTPSSQDATEPGDFGFGASVVADDEGDTFDGFDGFDGLHTDERTMRGVGVYESRGWVSPTPYRSDVCVGYRLRSLMLSRVTL